MERLNAVGLIVFVVTVAFNAGGLMLDAALAALRLPTVTEFCRKNPWAAAIIIFINIVGLIGLCLHFTEFNGEEK